MKNLAIIVDEKMCKISLIVKGSKNPIKQISYPTDDQLQKYGGSDKGMRMLYMEKIMKSLSKENSAAGEVVKLLRQKRIKFDVTLSELTDLVMIGIQGKGVYHWFKDLRWDKDFSNFGKINFDHTYSQNNGKTSKGWRHRINVVDGLNKKLGKELFS